MVNNAFARPHAAADADRTSGDALRMMNVEVRYQGAVGVRSITLHVGRGETVAILGANGAGKTTTLRAISGFLPGDRARVTCGSIEVYGRSVVGMPPVATARRGIALVPERNKVFGDLTVWQNLLVAGPRRAMSKAALDRTCELFPFIPDRRDQLAGSLSGGERQMLAIGRALMLQPTLLLIDELSFGLAPIVIDTIIARLELLKTEDLAVVVVEQNIEVARVLASRAYVLSVGETVADGPIEDVVAHGDAASAYLGVEEAEPR